MVNKIKNWKDLEFEINLFNRCNPVSNNHLSVGQILNAISEGIEESLMNPNKNHDGIITKIIKQYRYQSFLKNEKWNPNWKFPKVPLKSQVVSEIDSILRVKTAMTAFMLHNGKFNKHPLFGTIDKSQWEFIHIKYAEYLLSFVELAGREKFETKNNQSFHNKKKYFHKKKKEQKNSSPREKK